MNSRRIHAAVRACALALCAVFPSGLRALPPEPVTETTTEFTTAADLDGDGVLELVVVDKATGQYRLAVVPAAGVPAWNPARPSGLADIAGFSTGPLLAKEAAATLAATAATNRADLVFASRTGNRLSLLNAEPTLANPQPFPVYPPGLQPNFVVAVDVGGAGANLWHDVFSSSVGDGGANPNRVALTRNLGGTFQPLFDAPIPAVLERGNRVLPRTNSPSFYAAALGRGPAASQLNLFDFTTGTARLDATLVNLPATLEYAAGTFSNRALMTFLLYVPGTSNILAHPLAEIAPNDFDWAVAPAATLHPTTNRIDAVQVLSGGGKAQVGIVSNDGTLAEIYAYDGLASLVRVAVYTATADAPFTRFVGSGNGGLQLMSGKAGISTSFLSLRWNGASFDTVGGGAMPVVSRSAGQANVVQYQREPFVDPAPVLLALNSIADWASLPSFGTNTGPGVTNRVLKVTGESFLNPTAGLSAPTPGTLATEAATTHALVAQYAESIAVTPLTPGIGTLVSDLRIKPASGVFDIGITMTLTAGNPSDRLFFRTNGSPWVQYAKALYIYRDTVVEAYGQAATGNARSAIAKANYLFTKPWYAIDSDGDGVPDFVEDARGLDPRGGPDQDHDGFSDFDELMAGSNPLVGTDKPSTNHTTGSLVFPVDLRVTPQPHLVPPPGGGAAPGTVVSARTLQGALISSAATVTPSASKASSADLFLDFAAGSVLAVSTPEHFSVSPARIPPTEPSGRELLALTSIPPPAFETVPFVPPVSNVPLTLTQLASAWEANARQFLLTNPPPLVDRVLQPIDVLAAVLMERKLDLLIPTNAWPRSNRLSVFPHRPGDAGRTNPPVTALNYLTSKGASNTWHLAHLLGSLDDGARNLTQLQVVQLRLLNASLYGVCTYSNITTITNGTNVVRLSTFPPLVDALRSLVESNALPQPYAGLAAFSPSFVSNAAAGARIVLDSVHPRPRVDVPLVVVGNSFIGDCGTLLDESGKRVALRDGHGRAYAPGAAFDVPPGALVRVLGFEDVAIPSCADRAIEVVALALTDVPPGSHSDIDGDGLDDAWELAFLGGTLDENGANDHDGDGFSNRQELLAGTDPANAASKPPGEPPGSEIAADGIPASPAGNARIAGSPDGSVDVTTDGVGEDGVTLDGGDADGIEAGVDESGGAAPGAALGQFARFARIAADSTGFPSHLILRSFGTTGAGTNRPLGVTAISFADNVLTIVADNSVLGAKSNRVVFLGPGLVPLRSIDVANLTPIRVVGTPPSTPGGASSLGGIVGKVAVMLGNPGNDVATVVQAGGIASEAVGDALGDAEDGDGGGVDTGKFAAWPKRVELPGGGVVSNVVSVLTVPLDATTSVQRVARISLRSTDAGSFRLHQSGLVRDGFAYAATGGNRIRGTRDPSGQGGFALVPPPTIGGIPVGDPVPGLHFRIHRSLDVDQVLAAGRIVQFQETDWESLLGASALDLPAQALASGDFSARLRARTLAGPLEVALVSHAGANGNSRLELTLAGAVLRGVGLLVLDDSEGKETCAFRLPTGALGSIPASAKIVSLQPHLPVPGATTRVLEITIGFAAPVIWTHPVSGETCTGRSLRLRAELARPIRLRTDRPLFIVDGPPVNSDGTAVQPVQRRDWGDAPDAPYPTLASRSGASHRIVAGLRLGRLIDGERNGHPTPLALGDDTNGVDDDDGVAFLTPLVAGKTAAIAVRVHAASGSAKLDAFIDFNADGDWLDAGEKILSSKGVTNGINLLTFAVPAGATNKPTYARFRLSTAGGLGPTGDAADGEVEDYRVRLGNSNAPVVIRRLAVNGDGRAVVEATFDADAVFTLESSLGIDGEGGWEPESDSVPGSALGGGLPGDPVEGRQRFYRLRQE